MIATFQALSLAGKALSAIKVPLIMGAILAASGALLYITHSLKQAGAAKVETAMLRSVIETNQQVAEAREVSFIKVSELSRKAKKELEDLKSSIPQDDDQTEGGTACPAHCSYQLHSS